MCDMFQIKHESMNNNNSFTSPLEKHEHPGVNLTNQATSPVLRQQTPQLQATEVTSSGTVSTIPMVSKCNLRLKNSMDIKNYTTKHPIISKYLTSNIDSVQNNLQNKHSLNAESLVRRGFAGPEDIASQKGIFGWTTIDGINLPYLFRFNVKYVAVRMVEMSLLSRYPPEIPSEAKDQPPIISYYITEHEAELLNEINISHCSYEFGYTPYCQKDLLVKLEDVERFYTTVKLHYYKSDVEIESSEPVQIEKVRLVRAKQTVVPYIVRNGAKLVALNSLKKNSFLSGHKNFLEFNLSPWEVKHLNSCYELMKIPCRLSSTSKVVMLDELQLHCDISDLGIVTLGKLNDIQTSLAENSIERIESLQHHSNNIRQDVKNSTAMSTHSHRSPSPVLTNRNKNNLINVAKPLPSQRPPPPLIAMQTSHIRKAPPMQSCTGSTNNDNSLLVISHVESLAKSPNIIPDRLQDMPRGNNSHLSPLNLSSSKEKIRKLVPSNFQNTSSFSPVNHRERHQEYTESNCSNSFPTANHYRENPQEHSEANFSNTSPFHQTNHNRERLQEHLESNFLNTSTFSPNHNQEIQQAQFPSTNRRDKPQTCTTSNVSNTSAFSPINCKDKSREYIKLNVSNASQFSPTNHQERFPECSESNFRTSPLFHPPNCSRERLQESRDLNSLEYSSVSHNASINNISRETQEYIHSQLERPLEGNVIRSHKQSSQRNAEKCSCCQISSPSSQRINDRKNDSNIPVISNIFSLNPEKEQAYFSSVITSNDPGISQRTKSYVTQNDHTSISKNHIPSVIHNDHASSATQSDRIPSPIHQDPMPSPIDKSEIKLIRKRSSENDYEEEYASDYQEIIKQSFLQQLAENKNQNALHKKDSISDHEESTKDQSSDTITSKAAERALWEDHYLDKEHEVLIKYDRLFNKFSPKADSGIVNDQKIDKITHSPLGALRGGLNFKIQLMLISDQLLPTVNLEQYNLDSSNRAVLLSFVLCTFFPRENFKTLAFLLENILNVNLLRICSGQVLAYRRFFSRLWAKHSWSLTMIRVDDLIKNLPQLRFVFFKESVNTKQDDISKTEETPVQIKRSRSE